MNVRVFTGGQTGVDTGALKGAARAGAKWSAIFPKDFRRESPAPLWMMAHAKELPLTSYQKRTEWCVDRADAVLLVAHRLTPGTALTKYLAEKRGIPCWWHCPTDAWLLNEDTDKYHHTREWLRGVASYDQPISLMVAGPRESKWLVGEAEADVLVHYLLNEQIPIPEEIPSSSL